MNSLDSKAVVRCAIYTRKSTSEGSEQDFTSLDAQREAAENYIASQKSQGWTLSDIKYDDYGFTGANMERPSLNKLISDINEGKIDCVVVYKVDRLSRSLLDFTKLLQLFENKGVTFVSVTQHFNTNSSMGRLTLNILLSFAQFEREIISERTRDKLSAAKRKGKFVGGRPGLGYDLDKINHRLIINPKEAAIVKEIFDLYLKEKAVLNVTRIITEKGYRTKRITLNGRPAGGITFSTGTINCILKNMVYTGRVVSNGEIYPAEHEAIIPIETFNKVQSLLKENRPHNNVARLKHVGLLTKMFYCKACQKSIFYSYVRKKNYNYTCYICVEAQKRGYAKCPTGYLNGQRTEEIVVNCLRSLVKDKRLDPDRWNLLTVQDKREIFQSIVTKVEYDANAHTLHITLTDGRLHTFPINLKMPLAEKKETIEDKIKKEPRIRQVLLLAHQIQDLLKSKNARDLKEIANWLNVTPPRAHQITNLLRLSPSIQEDIILSNDPILLNIPEHKLRPIHSEKNHSRQLLLWSTLRN